MKRFLFLLTSCLLCLSLPAQEEPLRPRIYGIGWVRLRVTNLEKAKHFCEGTLQLKEFPNKCFTPSAVCLWINETQKLELIPTSSPGDKGGLDLVGFFTLDLNKMRRYLYSRGLVPGEIVHNDGEYFELPDSEGHPVAFESAFEHVDYVLSPVSSRILHVGFVVRDPPREYKFYMDILDFEPYWHGGMKDDETNWVAMQVPDGTDWIEYMLNISPTADKRTLGVMNHISLGVKDIKVAAASLEKSRANMRADDSPKIGRDGKWQYNLYDPDDTRVELMEFTPVEKPCCSEYTGPHPKP
jgi:catechol 2,3-dioxygenase-like lactoylglutathione lyase family enzyme